MNLTKRTLPLIILFALNAEPVVHLTPHPFDQGFREVVCTRPMRSSEVRIEHETVGTKNITHCYGHGSYGWTILWASVQKSINLSQASPNEPIAIIGAGCIGLALALELELAGYKNITIYAKELYNLPSWKAGAFFAIDTHSSKDFLSDLAVKSFLVYQQIDEGIHSYLSPHYVRKLYCYDTSSSDFSCLIDQKVIPEGRVVTIDFGNAQHTGMLESETFFIDSTGIMSRFHELLIEKQIPIIQKEITSFEELPETIIFNCSGLGAKELLQDDQLEGYFGHLLILNEASNSKHLDYIINAEVFQNEKPTCVYTAPKQHFILDGELCPCSGIIGGTFIPQNGQSEEFHQEQFRLLYERAHEYFYGTPLLSR